MSGSISRRLPSPVQSGQAPCGELKLKLRGAGSSKLPPCSGQAYRSLKSRSVPSGPSSGKLTSRVPSDEAQRGLDGVRHAGGVRSLAVGIAGCAVADRQAVDDHIDAVLVLLVEADLLVEVAQLAVDPDADEARLLGPCQHLLVLALPVSDERRHDHQARSLREVVELVDHLLHRLARDLPAADGAVHAPDAGEQEAQVVVDLRHGAHRRPRVPRRALLVDADRRREPVDLVDVRLLHLARGTAARRRRATRRSVAGPRRRSCRRRGSTSPIRRAR